MRFDGMITVERHAGVLHAVLAAPPENALGPPLLSQLHALGRYFGRSDAKVLMISSGLPGVFATGPDLRHREALDVAALADQRDALTEALEQLSHCGRPSIAVVDGVASGAGLELAMACSLRLAGTGARLSLPEVKLGMLPGGGGTQRLPKLVGRGRALELMLSGREIPGEEAERIGLVDRVFGGDLAGHALQLAAQLAGYSSAAMAAIVSCVDAAYDLPQREGMAVERVALAATFEEGDAREGISALIEERPPAFR